jgi:hypothetical protein
LTYYTATKNSFTLPEITIGQDKIHGSSAHNETGKITNFVRSKYKSERLVRV